MNNRNIIGSNLKFWRKKRQLSQEAFAAKLHLMGLNLDRSAISRIESYSREVYDYELICFCIVLDISIIDLLYQDTHL